MSNHANQTVRLFNRDVNRVLAMGDKLVVIFYLSVGLSISHALFGFPDFFADPVHLILAIAAFIGIGLSWAACRSVLRQRHANTSHQAHLPNSIDEGIAAASPNKISGTE